MNEYVLKSMEFRNESDPCMICTFRQSCYIYKMTNRIDDKEIAQYLPLIKFCIANYPKCYIDKKNKPQKRYVLVSRGGNEILSSSSRWGLILQTLITGIIAPLFGVIIWGIIYIITAIFNLFS